MRPIILCRNLDQFSEWCNAKQPGRPAAFSAIAAFAFAGMPVSPALKAFTRRHTFMRDHPKSFHEEF
jgi:hypothetical protein